MIVLAGTSFRLSVLLNRTKIFLLQKSVTLSSCEEIPSKYPDISSCGEVIE